jgi:type I restriction enzyme, S subunit
MKRWETRPLGEVAEFINGRAFKPSDWSPTGVPIIRIQNLTDRNASANRYAGTFDDRHAVRDGDLLISWSATLDAFIWNRGNAVLNQHIFKVIPKPSQVLKTYLFFALKSVMDELRSKTHGATMKHITKGPFERTMIPLPPVQEQERIAKLLDEADELGKLRAQADHRTAALIPALFNGMFGGPDENPKGWPKSPLGEHIDLLTGFPFKSEEYVDSKDALRLCRGANVLPQRIDWSDVRYWPTYRVKGVEKYKLRDGDTILAMDRPWISGGLKVARLGKADLPCLLVQRVARIRPLHTLISDFIYHSLCHPDFAAHCNLVKSETTVPHISPSNIGSFAVPIPPLSLQREFAERVSEIRKLEAEQVASRVRIDDLFQSMLHRSFNGEL